MASEKRHPYLTREFWKKNKFWKNEYHGKHEVYEEIHKSINEAMIEKTNDRKALAEYYSNLSKKLLEENTYSAAAAE